LIVNADDWALSVPATNRILECVRAGVVSSVSAMVFMRDSERAAELAREHTIHSGIHLNLTCGFTAPNLPQRLQDHQQRTAAFLRFRRFSRGHFNPLLARSFDYAVKAQMEEFERLYGARPARVDGHHNMHLCANVLVQDLLPRQAVVRRIESFAAGEKSAMERLYRRMLDRLLARRYRMPDYFFALLPMEAARIHRIVELARTSTVELGTHPADDSEYAFLMNGGLADPGANVGIAQGYGLCASEAGKPAAAIARRAGRSA